MACQVRVSGVTAVEEQALSVKAPVIASAILEIFMVHLWMKKADSANTKSAFELEKGSIGWIG